MATTQIFRRKISNNLGLTLIEVMVVLAVIGAIISLVIPRIGNQNRQIKAAVRKITLLSKQLHSSAKMQNASYRMVLELSGPEGKTPDRIWVEKSKQVKIFGLQASEEAENQEDDEEDSAPTGGFEADQKILKKPLELPSSLKILDVEIPNHEVAITSGKVYIHYLPSGLVEEAVIHLQLGDKNKWTIAIHPLTGKGEVASEYVSLKEIQNQK